MRRTLITTTLLTAAGIALTGASTCGPQSPGERNFAAGSLVIPMDNCYQRRDSSTPSQSLSNPNAGCTAASGATDGVFRAYGLVYFLLKHNVPVYWAIDNTKTSVTAADITVTVAAGVAAQKLNWADGTFADVTGLGTTVNYIGGPFVIDAGDVTSFNVISLLQSDPDFARFKAAAIVDVHKAGALFHAKQVRPLSGPPPRIAILNINSDPTTKKTSSNVMYQYAVAAGLSWPCNGTGDCAGGLGPSCKKADVLAYLAAPGPVNNRDTAIPQVCTPTGSTLCAPNFNTGPGLIYDLLCDGDFVPPAGGKYTDTALAKGNYKMLWIPHWDSSGATPSSSPALPPVTDGDWLAWQLASISSFVNSGNNLFVECMGIQALEGIPDSTAPNGNPIGIPATRFQTPNGILKWNGSGTLQGLLDPTHPNVQIGDFALSVVSGAITTFYPDADTTKAVGAAYLPTVKRLITESATPPPLAWDASSTIQVTGSDGALRGAVAYLGGHNYSPDIGSTLGGQTAGTRIVLNTLFNLGFGCSDPNTTCTTGLLGACAQGVLKCAPGGGLQCVGAKAGALDCTTPGADANCNGVPDANEQACQPVACAEGAQRSCYDGKAGTAGVGQCKTGTQTCTGGLWGACEGEVIPQPEVCNGLDDDCNGQIDDGTLCSSGYTCQPGVGVCLPTTCNNESARCPAGFECLTSGGSCTAVPCGASNTACPVGKVCQSGQCVEPCQGLAFTCGAGSGCSNGQCVAGGCTSTQCADSSQACVSGICVKDPCAGLTCPTGTFCRVGPAVGGTHVADCVRSCSYVGCAADETCSADGFCEPACSPACAAGLACVNGACVTDPKCATVQCGAGQSCSGGVCVDDACKNVHCNGVGACTAGQCLNGGITTSQTTPIKQASSGGCGTGGGGDLAALALLGAALATRRRRLAPALATAVRRAAPAALALLLVAGAACSKKGGGTASCTAPQTACGAECADLQTSALHCGACGHGCASGFQCVAGGCVLPTGNPHLLSVTPSTLGRGAAPALKFTFDGLDPASPPSAMTVRLSGAVPTQELPLTLGAAGTATLPAQAMDLTGEAAGTASQPATIEVRLLNMPGRLVSNPLTLTVVDALVARTLTPALVSQSKTTTQTLDLQGLGFLAGATVAMAPTGTTTPVALSNLTVKGPGELTVDAPAPSTLKLGRYDVTVSNPGGATSNPLAFTVTEGTPVLGTVNGTVGTCVQSGGRFDGTASGQFFYPSSVVHVTGNSIADSPLDTSCLNGTDALGQCVGGQIHVSADLTLIQPGTYDVTVVNPGTTPLASNKITITVKTSCP